MFTCTYIRIHIFIHTHIYYIHIHAHSKGYEKAVGEGLKIIFTYFKNIPSSIGKTTDAEAEQTVTG